MNGRLRLFVAADVPERHLLALAEALSPWRDRLRGARWAEPAGQHVTLKFLGGVDEARLDEVVAITAAGAAACRAAAVRLAGFGAFPSRKRMRVLWVGVDDPAHVLGRLAVELAERFRRLGFAPEARPFRAHLTLARFRLPVPFPDGLPDEALAALPRFDVGQVVLYRSHLSPKGARYEPLRYLPLAPCEGSIGEDAGAPRGE